MLSNITGYQFFRNKQPAQVQVQVQEFEAAEQDHQGVQTLHVQAPPAAAASRLVTQVLEMGKDEVVSFAGTSQFTAQGVSACGLAAFNFARIGVRIEQHSKCIAEVLDELSTREAVEEIVAICAGWSSSLHLEVEEVHELPIFGRFLKLTSIEYGPPRQSFFQKLLQTMKAIEKSTVMIITRPPEIIACFKFATSSVGGSQSSDTAEGPVFVVFDSHPRPSHPHGAGLSFSTSIESTARTLSDILPTMDEDVYNSSDYGWQAQLLSNCSAHLFIARHRHKDHDEAVLQASVAILTLRSQISELRHQNDELKSDNRRLGSEVNRLRTSLQQEQLKVKQQQESSFWPKFLYRTPGRSFGLYSHAVAGPSGTSSMDDCMDDPPSMPPVKRPRPNIGARGAQSIFADNPPPIPFKSPPVHDSNDAQNASEEDEDSVWLETAQFALQLQSEFDKEDRWLRQEHAELAQYLQSTFQCGICMDDLPEGDVARAEGCTHMTCRTCLRAYVASKIEEHRYPIFCPMCTIAESQAQPGMITRPLIEELGIDEEQSMILTEMELFEFTVQVHCRMCRRPASVDREDYAEAINIVCPQIDCHHVWCKKCEQTIVVDGPRHSCDGSSELDHLMKEKGWKHCPNCTTPIQKESGCNHMRCISSGCNTHFCYICGGLIVRSALNRDVGEAVSAHFRKCQLFEVPA